MVRNLLFVLMTGAFLGCLPQERNQPSLRVIDHIVCKDVNGNVVFDHEGYGWVTTQGMTDAIIYARIRDDQGKLYELKGPSNGVFCMHMKRKERR